MDETYFEEKRRRARELYTAERSIYSPYFKQNIILNSDGFHHLQFSARRERSREEQVLKFTLLPLGLYILKTATTLQEYRKLFCPIGKRSPRDGLIPMKMVQWWGLIAIFIAQDIKVRVVTRQVGDGNITFWSVMPYSKLHRGNRGQKLFTEGIENE